MAHVEPSEDGQEYIDKRDQLAPIITMLYKLLSSKERQVLGLLQTDLSEEDIATKLHLSRWAVRTYRARIQRKVRGLAKGADWILFLENRVRF